MRREDQPKRKILRYIGKDEKDRPVYRDETGMIWKWMPEEETFYFCFNFYGEPFRPMKEDIIRSMYESEVHNGR